MLLIESRVIIAAIFVFMSTLLGRWFGLRSYNYNNLTSRLVLLIIVAQITQATALGSIVEF